MKRRRLYVFALTLAILAGLCAACGESEDQAQGEYVLYFMVSGQTAHGPALGTQAYDTDSCTAHPEGEACPDPEELMTALLTGPEQEGLSSPFPRGTALQNWDWDPDKKGNLQVRLSEQYSGLTDISLTLADYCIVLTLSQLEGVESVEISSEGHTANYRSHPLLTAEEAQLTDAWGMDGS